MKLSKRILAGLTAVFLLSGCFLAASAEDDGLINVAPQAKVESSGYSSQMTAWALIDGSLTSAWSSNTANNTWFSLDLGRKMAIERIELVARQDVDQAHTRNNFVVEVSNSSSFQDAVVVAKVGSTGFGHKDTFKAEVGGGKYRFVRYRRTSGNYSFFAEARVLVKKENMPTDGIEKSEIANRLDLLTTLGVDVDALSENVTRGEAAVAFATLMKISSGETDYYTDIKDEAVLIAANALCEADVLSKPSDGKFNPQRPITYTQAVKMAVSALGCSVRAEYLGGFPTGYNTCARELRIVSGVDSANFNKEAFINLLYNMLEANVYEISTVKEDSVLYAQDSDTFLKRYYDIKKVTGVVEENYAFTTYLGKENLDKNQLLIDSKKYRFEKEEYIDLFGKSVHCYYKEDKSGNKDVVFMYPDADQQKLQLSLIDFREIKGQNVEYGDKHYRLDNNYKLIKNGGRISLSGIGTLTGDGILELYDNDGDNSYEIVHIIETTTKILKSVRTNDTKTTLNFKDNSRIDVSKNDKVFIKYDNGDYAEINGLSENDIVSYFKTTGIFMAYVGSKTYENKITQLTDKKAIIDFVDSYNIAKNAVDINSKILGKYGTIYFDYMGNVFWYDSTVSAGNGYGYWIGYADASGFTDARIRVFTENGTFSVYTISAPMTIDGATYNDSAAAASAIKTMWNNKPAADVGIVIKYTANTNMKLKTFDTDNGTETGEDNCLDKLYDPSGAKYYSYGIHDERFIVDKNAVIFQIPKSVRDEDDFSVITGSQLKNKSQYKLHGYTHDKTTALPTIFAGVIDSSKPGFKERDPLFVIKEISQTYLNEESVPLLTGYSEGKEYSYTLDEDLIQKFGNEISVGDVLRVRVDENNMIVNARYIYNNKAGNVPGGVGSIVTDSTDRILNFSGIHNSTVGNGQGFWSGSSVYNTPLYASMGVYAQEGEYIHLRKMKLDRDSNLVFEEHEGYAANKDYILSTSIADIYFVDKTTGDVTIGSVSDIVSFKDDPTAFSKVVVRVHSGETLEIVVYN